MLIQPSCPSDRHTGENGTNKDKGVHCVDTKEDELKGNPHMIQRVRRGNRVDNVVLNIIFPISAPLSRRPLFHASLK